MCFGYSEPMHINSTRRPSAEGFIIMRAGCFATVIILGLLIGGGQMIYTGIKNRSPQTISTSDYLANGSSAEWIHLTGACLDLADCATLSKKNEGISELYVPVRAPGEGPGAPVKLLFNTADTSLVGLVGNLQSAGNNPARLAKLEPELRSASAPRGIIGLIQFGIDSDRKTRQKLERLNLKLANDYYVIKDGAKPNLMLGAAMFAVGLVLGFWMLMAGKDAPPPSSSPNLPPRQFEAPPPLPPRR